MLNLVFMVEEPSMKELLNVVLPKMLPEDILYRIIDHRGKNDLMISLPRKLQAWQDPDTKFVVVHDQDNNDCRKLKKHIEDICNPLWSDVLIRIACRELEAWYFGDLSAVSHAYNKPKIAQLSGKRKFRTPDDIVHPKEELLKLIPEHQQILGAQKIAPYMEIENNTSHSFKVFINGVHNLISGGQGTINQNSV